MFCGGQDGAGRNIDDGVEAATANEQRIPLFDSVGVDPEEAAPPRWCTHGTSFAGSPTAGTLGLCKDIFCLSVSGEFKHVDRDVVFATSSSRNPPAQLIAGGH